MWFGQIDNEISPGEIISELDRRQYFRFTPGLTTLPPITTPVITPTLLSRQEIIDMALDQELGNRGWELRPRMIYYLDAGTFNSIVVNTTVIANRLGAGQDESFIEPEIEAALIRRGYNVGTPWSYMPETPASPFTPEYSPMIPETIQYTPEPETVTYPEYTPYTDELPFMPATIPQSEPVILPERTFPVPVVEAGGINWLLLLGMGAAAVIFLGGEEVKKRRIRKKAEQPTVVYPPV